MNEPGFESKIVLLGETGVGKTSIVVRYVERQFLGNISPTIGASFLTKTVTLDDTRLKLQLWDTAGQERFRSLAPMYYRGAEAALLVYNVGSEESFWHMKEWVKELKTNIFDDILMFVVGNQADRTHWQVSAAEATEFAQSINAGYFEVSAKKNTGIDELFLEVAKSLMKLHTGRSVMLDSKKFESTLPAPSQQKSGCC